MVLDARGILVLATGYCVAGQFTPFVNLLNASPPSPFVQVGVTPRPLNERERYQFNGAVNSNSLSRPPANTDSSTLLSYLVGGVNSAPQLLEAQKPQSIGYGSAMRDELRFARRTDAQPEQRTQPFGIPSRFAPPAARQGTTITRPRKIFDRRTGKIIEIPYDVERTTRRPTSDFRQTPRPSLSTLRRRPIDLRGRKLIEIPSSQRVGARSITTPTRPSPFLSGPLSSSLLPQSPPGSDSPIVRIFAEQLARNVDLGDVVRVGREFLGIPGAPAPPNAGLPNVFDPKLLPQLLQAARNNVFALPKLPIVTPITVAPTTPTSSEPQLPTEGTATQEKTIIRPDKTTTAAPTTTTQSSTTSSAFTETTLKSTVSSSSVDNALSPEERAARNARVLDFVPLTRAPLSFEDDNVQTKSPFSIEKLNMLLKKRYYAKRNITLTPPTATTEAAPRLPRAYNSTKATIAPTTQSTTPEPSKATTPSPSLSSILPNYASLPGVAAAPAVAAAPSNVLPMPDVRELIDLGLAAEQAIPAFQQWSQSLQSTFKQNSQPVRRHVNSGLAVQPFGLPRTPTEFQPMGILPTRATTSTNAPTTTTLPPLPPEAILDATHLTTHTEPMSNGLSLPWEPPAKGPRHNPNFQGDTGLVLPVNNEIIPFRDGFGAGNLANAPFRDAPSLDAM